MILLSCRCSYYSLGYHHDSLLGLKSDTVGPLEYNPSIDIKFSTAPRPKFTKDRSNIIESLLRQAKSAPGPGYYNSLSTFDILDINKEGQKHFQKDLRDKHELDGQRDVQRDLIKGTVNEISCISNAAVCKVFIPFFFMNNIVKSLCT